MKKLSCMLLITLALSCAKEKDAIPTINLSENLAVDVNPDFLLNEIVESVTFTQLEAGDSLFHGMLSLKRINDNEDYCFVDLMKNNTILIYRKEGKLISNFNRTGRGEGEFLWVNSLHYDGDDKIEVLFSENNTLYHYNRKGEYLSKMNIANAYAVIPTGEGKYLALMNAKKENGVKDCVRIIDSKGNECEGFLPIDTTQTDGLAMPAISVTRSHDGYNFLINTVQGGTLFYNYNIDNNTVVPICRFDVGTYGVTPEIFTGGGNPSQFILVTDAHRINNYLFVPFFNRGPICIDVWDLTTCRLMTRRSADSSKTKGELDYKLPNGTLLKIPFGRFMAHNDQLVVICSAASLAGNISETIDPEGNDVIVTFKLKK